jgi:tetratricopeptide (TPR) repeat protein
MSRELLMTNRLLVYLGCLALLVPLGALAAGAPDGVVAPFGWSDVAVVHLLALLPLSLLTSRHVPRPQSRSQSLLVGVSWFAIAIGAAWLTASRGADFAGQLDPASGFSARLVIRFLWSLCLQLPWCLAAQAFMNQAPSESRPWMPPGPATALSLLAAFLLPAAYARSVIDAQSAKAEELLRAGRLVRAQPLVHSLGDVAGGKPIFGMNPRELRQKIDQDIRAFSAAVSQPMPDSATAETRLARARAFAVLGRPDDALHLLKPLAPTDATACLLLAAVLQGEQRWQESNHYYRAALQLLNDQPAQDAAALANRVKAYDSLAFNAREQGAYQDAEAIYYEAMASLAEAKPHFHFQLGRHYQQAGRPALAVEHLETAARLAPESYAKLSRPLIDKMNLHTPSCLLRWAPP